MQKEVLKEEKIFKKIYTISFTLICFQFLHNRYDHFQKQNLLLDSTFK